MKNIPTGLRDQYSYDILRREINARGLVYEPDTGTFRWESGNRCGYIRDGYLVISVGGKQYRAHRLAFLIMTSTMPAYVDHANRNRLDNRWCNLREATKAENCRNASRRVDNTSGVRGVSWNKEKGKYRAYIMVYNKQHHLGFFESKAQATAARTAAARKYHLNFAN